MVLDSVYPQVALAALLALLMVSWTRCHTQWRL
jgi:hypothetical protein